MFGEYSKSVSKIMKIAKRVRFGISVVVREKHEPTLRPEREKLGAQQSATESRQRPLDVDVHVDTHTVDAHVHVDANSRRTRRRTRTHTCRQVLAGRRTHTRRRTRTRSQHKVCPTPAAVDSAVGYCGQRSKTSLIQRMYAPPHIRSPDLHIKYIGLWPQCVRMRSTQHNSVGLW